MNTYPTSYSPVPGGSAQHLATGVSPTKMCVCGGAGCEQCRTEGFVRPQFFAGQLLTEEDLQALGNYVVSKNRLHNRHFFGEGVVCGLEVTCHPCGGGTVIVHPGYALDCCGNDIVLSCPQTLDINAMVRELRIKLLGGYDCGDPCKGKAKDLCEDAKTSSTDKVSKGYDVGHADTAREYCLYIRYCEELTDPVTPYSTDEPCGAQACHATRVREGVRFELRCREEDKSLDDLLTRICCCLGDLDSAEKSVLDSAWHRSYVRKLRTAEDAIKTYPLRLFTAEDVDAIDAATTQLQTMIGQVTSEPRKVWTEETLQEVINAALNVASLVARFSIQTKESQDALFASHEGLQAKLTAASDTFHQTTDQINAEIIKTTLTLPLDQEYAITLLEVGGQVTAPFRSGLVEAAVSTVPLPVSIEIRFLAERAVFTRRLFNASTQSLDFLREWLLDRLDRSPFLTDCRLRQEVISVVLAAPTIQQNIRLSDATALVTATDPLTSALWRYLRDCLCAALNPPCPPCEDTAVLLACLKVKDCEVISICNLERTFVLSPVALRYWLPPLRFLDETVEKLCCGELKLPAKNFPIYGLRYLFDWLRWLCRKDAKLTKNLLDPIYAMFQGPALDRGLAGLQESGEPYQEVTLSAGMAIDGTGREIVVPEAERLSEDLFDQLNVAVTNEEAWYPVFLIGRDEPATPTTLVGACDNTLPTGVLEGYEVTFGRPGDELELDKQDAPDVVDGPGSGTWRVLLGFVQWYTSKHFKDAANESGGIGRRYAGVLADTVAARGGRLTLRTGANNQAGKLAVVMDETDGGLLTFGMLTAQGVVTPVFSVNAKGDVEAEGTIKGAVLPGSVQIQSGVATDGIVLPLPPGITEEQVANEHVTLHIHLTPHFPGAMPSTSR